jgi:hypothetical protein
MAEPGLLAAPRTPVRRMPAELAAARKADSDPPG